MCDRSADGKMNFSFLIGRVESCLVWNVFSERFRVNTGPHSRQNRVGRDR